MCTMVVTQLPTAPLLLLLLAVKLGAKGTVHSLLRGPTGTSRVLGLRASSGGKVKALGWSARTFHVAPFSLEALLRLASLFLPLGLSSKSFRKSGVSTGLKGLAHAWLACGWWTCVVLLDLRKLLIAREPPGPVASSAFLLGSLPVTTEMERVTGLAAEALLGRRDTGGGKPVRLRSTRSGLPSGGPARVREPFMVDEGALRGPGLGRRACGVSRRRSCGVCRAGTREAQASGRQPRAPDPECRAQVTMKRPGGGTSSGGGS